jgi:radical SAM protein with 4Fe4S-binding SPASM domain
MITRIQIDPNGLCNAKCWFCPVAYAGNPKIGRSNMSLEMLEDILKQLKDGQGDFVTTNTIESFPFHFNEVLLYPHFKEMLELHRKYGMLMSVFSNGVNLTNEKIDIISEYKDVVNRIVLNIPSHIPEQWSTYTGFNVKLFEKMLNNVYHASKKLSYLGFQFMIQVNGINESSLPENGGWMRLLSKAPSIDLDNQNGDHAKTMRQFKKWFPTIDVIEDIELADRTTYLEKAEIMTNQESIKMVAKNKIVGCGLERAESWLHVSANGDVFLCCQDFNFETIFANVKEKSIKEIWTGLERKKMIKESFNGFCKTCRYAIWE